MLQIKRDSIVVKALLLLVISAIIVSFSGKPGGDVFKIYVNKKLLFEQVVYKNEPVKTIKLDQSLYNDEIDVYYSHCGVTGKGRNIAIKDGKNRLLKEWHYPDVAGKNGGMSLKVKDILALQKNKGAQLQLYYSSKELPGGKLLTSIVTEHQSSATP